MSDAANQRTARQRIIETALRLFYAQGVRATGIDQIIAVSGVAKMSFYRHFPSKSDLVCAFLEERHARWMAWLDDAVSRHARAGAPRLPLVADALREWFADPTFRGCAFINITSEFSDERSRERQLVTAHKRELQDRLTTLAHEDSHRDPSLAGRLALLIVDGAIVQAQIWGGTKAADDAKRCLAGLVSLEAATHRPKSAKRARRLTPSATGVRSGGRSTR